MSNELTGELIGAPIEVHRQVGPGLLEVIYEECLPLPYMGLMIGSYTEFFTVPTLMFQ